MGRGLRDWVLPRLTLVVLASCGDNDPPDEASERCAGFHFAEETRAPTTSQGRFALGDLDRDGDTDLVTWSSNPDRVSILRGAGDGTFGPPTDLTANRPRTIAIGDLDGDRKPDLVGAVSDSSATQVQIWFGHGDGTFGSPVTEIRRQEVWDNAPTQVAVADLNGDGNSDVVTANWRNDVWVLLGNGSGAFSERNAGSSSYFKPQSLVAKDVNGDGVPDLAVSSMPDLLHGVGSLELHLGDGSGTFLPPSAVSQGQFFSLALDDVNSDSKQDLLALSPDGLSIHLGNGDGTFHDEMTYKGSLSSGILGSLAVADVTRDDALDAIVLDGTGMVHLFTNEDGAFAPAGSQLLGTAGMHQLDDLNKDGIADLVVTDTVVTTYLGSCEP